MRDECDSRTRNAVGPDNESDREVLYPSASPALEITLSIPRGAGLLEEGSLIFFRIFGGGLEPKSLAGTLEFGVSLPKSLGYNE